MKILESIYNHSPILLQNYYLFLYGANLKRLRFGKEFRVKLEQLNNSQFYTAHELQSLQEFHLTRLLGYIFEYVPYYRAISKNIGVNPVGMNAWNAFKSIPVTTKEHVKDRPSMFLSTYYKRKNLKIIHTSGTTGTPLDIFTTKSAVQMNYAFFSRFLGWAGVRYDDPSATFAGRMIIPSHQKSPPYWRKNISMNNTLFSSYHLSESSLPAYIRELEREKVTYIDSYPSSIYTIAQYINYRSIEHAIRPKAIITSSETLHDHQRQAIETAFGCKVYDQYGSAEMSAFICQCEEGKYHINPEYGIVEVLDKDGKPVPTGTPGRLVCTGFLNYGMPLIRYDLGDTVVLSDQQCRCGRHFPVVESILGRTDDLIVTPSGRTIGRLDPVFKGLSFIRETQIVQEAYDRITVNLVKDAGFSDDTANALKKELSRRIGDEVNISIRIVEYIPRTNAGKFRSVISKVSKSG